MRATALNGYLLHSRAYQEKRAIYQFFSYEHGVVHGVGARGMPLFAPIWLMANGVNALKSFSQISLGFHPDFGAACDGMDIDDMPAPKMDAVNYHLIKGRVQYALLYMNEVLYKLLAAENPCPKLWQVYHTKTTKLHALDRLKLDDSDEMQAMRLYLRQFEQALFDELGVAMDYQMDGDGMPIDADTVYRFVPLTGFVPDVAGVADRYGQTVKLSRQRYRGDELLRMANAVGDTQAQLEWMPQLSQLQKELMDALLDYKPLNSRTLWQQSIRYMNSQ